MVYDAIVTKKIDFERGNRFLPFRDILFLSHVAALSAVRHVRRSLRRYRRRRITILGKSAEQFQIHQQPNPRKMIAFSRPVSRWRARKTKDDLWLDTRLRKASKRQEAVVPRSFTVKS